ncbi:hexapeptide transferase [Flavobacterium branchiophilum]|uniref:Hexapeptide transferase n=1 Tax=Flavobacterium branchiophilum TaxID=55197 RepID=A0A2H3KBW6_9FLAO|nr:hexapeptide transferase [Flavobacterium branchiophilum]
MLIAGAKGLAKEVLEVVYKQNPECNITFFDNISNDLPRKLFGRFSILRDVKEVEHYFNTVDKKFTIGIGNPLLRKAIHDMFVEIGGEYVSTISNASEIGSFDVEIGKGTNVLSHAIFSNSVRLGIGCLVYYRTTITHDCVVGDFVEMSPGVTLLGRCKVGSYSQIGSNATILPKVKIGRNVIVGAGAVVTKDVPDNSMVVGVPAKIIRKLEPLVDKIKSKKKL